jgi:large subunit ribosomal protein L3
MVQSIIGQKVGITRLFLESGEAIAVTAVEVGPCFITQVKDKSKDGYSAIQLGFGKANHLNSPEAGHLKDIEKLRHIHEFKTNDVSTVKRGQQIDVEFLKRGDLVNVSGFSKGRGFAGVVKRYHFAGGPKTHGQSDRHRAPGSIGATTSPGRVFKGTHMAGHMGARKVTVRNIEVIEADSNRNLLLLKGAVPGANKGLLFIEKVKR